MDGYAANALCDQRSCFIFESGTAAGLDFIIGVYAPETIRLQRAMRRDQADRESIKKECLIKLMKN